MYIHAIYLFIFTRYINVSKGFIVYVSLSKYYVPCTVLYSKQCKYNTFINVSKGCILYNSICFLEQI